MRFPELYHIKTCKLSVISELFRRNRGALFELLLCDQKTKGQGEKNKGYR